MTKRQIKLLMEWAFLAFVTAAVIACVITIAIAVRELWPVAMISTTFYLKLASDYTRDYLIDFKGAAKR